VSAPSRSDVEGIVSTRIPQTRFVRMDGLNFQDINALLAAIRMQAASMKK
jgi:hypothetical protein